jgi:aldehyde:ferredoxin oxidoreductase
MKMAKDKKEEMTRRTFLKHGGATAGAVALGFLLKPSIGTSDPGFRGWMGRVLEVNLTTGRAKSMPLDDIVPDYKDYIGGRGLGVRILYDRVNPTTDPLGPGNLLVFATGPLTGTSVPSSGRFCIVSKSPLARPEAGPYNRGLVFDSNSGGDWGELMKAAGFDAIIIKGKSDHPVYLWINDGKAQIRDARALWGKGTYGTTAAIKDEIGYSGLKVACIGPAGENLVRIAAIINDADQPGYGRACGRDGGGAIMGSKNLKAIAVYGTMAPAIAEPGKFALAVREADSQIREGPICGGGLPTFGTMVLNNAINGSGILPTCNFQWGMFKEANRTSGPALNGDVAEIPKTLIKSDGCCRTCSIECGRVTKIPNDLRPSYVKIGEGEGPEYESSWALGAMCGVDDLFATMEANYLCNDLGLDTISTGATIASAFELCQKRAMDLSEVGYAKGKNPFGSGEAMVKLVSKIASQEGVGREMAEGSLRMATRHGHPELSMSVKGLEFPAYDPRGVPAQGLVYATSNRGACHVRAYLIAAEVLERYCGASPPDIPKATVEYRLAKDAGKVDLTLIFQHLTAAIDCLDECLFTVFAIGADNYANMLSAATGIKYTGGDLLVVGERVWNLERLFNIREGLTKKDDRLPYRLENVPMPNKIYSAKAKRAITPPVEVPPFGKIEKQPSAGSRSAASEMLPVYYSKRGWSEDGVPVYSKLKNLGLTWART